MVAPQSFPCVPVAPAVLDHLELLRNGVFTKISIPLPGPLIEAARTAGQVEVTDAEGVPVARFPVGRHASEVGVGPQWLGHPSPRPFERCYLAPTQVKHLFAGQTDTLVIDRGLTSADLRQIAALDTPLCLLVLTGPSHDPDNPGVDTLRGVLGAAKAREDHHVIAVPIDPTKADVDWVEQVIGAYAVGPIRRLAPLTQPRPPRGAVVLFTGLSGSGKSTLARAVRDAIVEQSSEAVTLLDGDVVRRHLSAGLGFSPHDREVNVRRIGWVAARIARHGGLVIASPIAPYADTRAEVRADAEAAGVEFVLVYVSTPLAECERRDRKGLYARARAGEIADFTGVSAPYEAPTDADLVIDTSIVGIVEAREKLLALLRHPPRNDAPEFPADP
ncbi:MAG: adenylyl-sulfate kinase [Nostocoides sp.]